MLLSRLLMQTTQFGYHLTLDFYGCPKSKLDNMEVCYDSLTACATKIGMKMLVPPFVIRAPNNNKKDPGGFSGFVIIAESHISVHTFVARGFVSIDTYSCKIFDKKVAVDHFREIFEPNEIEEHFINRGLKYPSNN